MNHLERLHLQTAADPLISVIIPVLHEADCINPLIDHIRELEYPGVPVEIIVSDGSSEEDTLSAIRSAGVIRVSSGKGRAIQMNAGAEKARGEALLFLHADTMLPRDAFRDIVRTLEDMRIVAGAFDLGLRSRRAIYRITEKYVALRTRITRIPFGDQAIFVRKDYFRQMNGYREIPIMEDVELMKRIRRRGDRIEIIPSMVITSTRRWEREGILCGLFRNWTLQFMYSLGVRPELLVRHYPDEARRAGIANKS